MKIRLGHVQVRLSRYLAIWTVVALLFAIQNALRDGLDGIAWPASVYLRWSLIQWYAWAALGPLVFRLAERYPLQARAPRHWLEQLLASAGVTLLAMALGAFVSTAFEPSGFSEQMRMFIGQHAAIGMLTYWALYAIQQAMHFHAEKTRREVEAAQMASDLAQSRLQVLKTQLQPHFLFNTLHAVITLLDEDPSAAEDMLLRLSELLRALLEDYDGQEITLRRELVLLDLYLGIQRLRFRDRLTTQVYIAPDTLDCAVPSLILQPLVENAIRHGIGERVGADCIQIEARREDGSLCIDVRNRNSTLEKPAREKTPATGHGIGLSNTALRLRTLYGDDASVRLDTIWPEGVACRVRLPFREIEEADDMPEIATA
jgi:two-component system, LytTR family, sensor kinase